MNQDTRALLIQAVNVILRFFVAAWILMLAFELVHEEAPAIPPIGYWTSASIVLAVSVLISVAASAWRETE